ncbi:MAG: hypothetical protein ACRD1Q_02495, partial [Vicinamibacterales bacterium]
MRRRALVVVGAAVVVGALAAVSVAGQATWTPPVTPWGDPDLQGAFTNKDEQGIPFERPAEFADRAVLTEEEFAARTKRATKQLETDNADFDLETADRSNAGQVGSATSPPPHWLDRGKPTRRTSLIVDPQDGRIPSMTPNGRRQMEARVAARNAARRGPADSWEDRSLYDRCISRGLPGSMMPAI